MDVYPSSVLCILLGAVLANATLPNPRINHRDGSTASVFREIQSYLENNKDQENIPTEILDIFEDQGMDVSFLFSDSSTVLSTLKYIASLFSGSQFAKILKSTLEGKSTTISYTPYMLSFQIDCYFQAFQKGPVTAAVNAYNKYNGYGCYCGSGHAHNSNPVDATDRCCKIHDFCYNSAMGKYKLKQGCDTYATSYNATCCLQKTTICNDAGPSAARDLCLCDQAMASCVNVPNTLKVYNKDNKNARKKGKCGTAGTKPKSIWSIFTSCFNMSRRRAAVHKNRYRPPTCQTTSS